MSTPPTIKAVSRSDIRDAVHSWIRDDAPVNMTVLPACVEQLENRMINLIVAAVAAEREACAKLAEHDPAANCAHGPSHDSCIRQDRCTCLTDVIRGEAIARAIRARGQKPENVEGAP